MWGRKPTWVHGKGGLKKKFQASPSKSNSKQSLYMNGYLNRQVEIGAHRTVGEGLSCGLPGPFCHSQGVNGGELSWG